MQDKGYEPKAGNCVTRHQNGKNFVVKKIKNNWVILESTDDLHHLMTWLDSFAGSFFKKKTILPPK